ncbi:MAG: hypothetical protein B6D46_04715 [Polyangiaceae bacterium UTPRO1]|jgi:hypothetical protein|nr:DUF475 domain-containing protein [Myxococcales bacterium]OQY67981.1 MAG: hypothetical protein B6D46_04715 [Polyangiaceae bacterium UTPRO1]
MKYFRGSFLVTVAGLAAGAALGWDIHGTIAGVLGTTFIVGVLAVLEVSLSFDNAVVNATVLREMDPLWQRRFMTWGIAIAVFGMRIVFPLAIVAVIAHIDPWNAVVLSLTRPDEYSRIIASAHVSVAAFGGAFLLMVGFKHFLNKDKQLHWIALVERPLVSVGRIEAFGLGIVLFGLWAVAAWLPERERYEFLVAGIFGLITFIGVDGIAAIVDPADVAAGAAARSGAAAFLYLEVLDASFSFDGVIGAFALSNNLLVIAIGLGIGAMFVRSLTIMLVDRGTLTQYRYLEHGAFYAIIALGTIMFLGAVRPIPEAVTGLVGAGFIGLAFWHSLRDNRREGRA